MIFRKVLSWILRFFEAFFAFLFFYLIVTIFGHNFTTGEKPNNGSIVIYVQNNGIHTDICLPVNTKDIDWRSFLPTSDYPNAKEFEYVAIGWGDKGFFLDTPTWAELKASTAFNAAFLKSPTAMHVEYTGIPEINENRKKVRISRENYRKMIAFVKKQFDLKNGKVQLISGKGYSERDNFYEAHGSYHAFNTCNRFTNGALKAANVKTGVFVLFPDGIMKWL